MRMITLLLLLLWLCPMRVEAQTQLRRLERSPQDSMMIITNADSIQTYVNKAGVIAWLGTITGGNNPQTISISNDTIFLSDGGFAVLPPDVVLTDAQIASFGYIKSPNDSDADPTNELQTLSIDKFNSTTAQFSGSVLDSTTNLSIDLSDVLFGEFDTSGTAVFTDDQTVTLTLTDVGSKHRVTSSAEDANTSFVEFERPWRYKKVTGSTAQVITPAITIGTELEVYLNGIPMIDVASRSHKQHYTYTTNITLYEALKVGDVLEYRTR